MIQDTARETVACYCRVSTKKAQQELSLENQQKVFCEYAARNNYNIYDIYKDDGVSAKSMKNRDDFLRMVSDAKKGLFCKILVKDISRFARNTYDFLGVIRQLRAMGTEVRFLTADMSTLDSELTLTILAAVAQEESANLSKRVKFAKRQSALEGRVPSRVYGYDKGWGDRFSLSLNAGEAKVVQSIFHLYADQQMSSYGIADLLNSRSVPTKRGGSYRWSQSVVCGILRNRLYTGQVCTGKSEVKDFITGQRSRFPEEQWTVTYRPEFRIVDDELFAKAQAVRISRSSHCKGSEETEAAVQRRPSVKHPLSNLLVCADEGSSFRRRVGRGSWVGAYWVCSKRDRRATLCRNSVRIDEGQMHKALTRFMEGLFCSREAMLGCIVERAHRELRNYCGEGGRAERLIADERSLKAQLERLLDLYVSEVISSQALDEKLAQVQGRLKQVQGEIALLKQADIMEEHMAQVQARLARVAYTGLDTMLDNAFLKSIFRRLQVHPNGNVTAEILTANGQYTEIAFGIFTEQKSIPNQTDCI